LPAWPWCTAPLGAAGALVELPGSRQSPAPWPVETPPNQSARGGFPPHGLCCPVGPSGTVDPPDSQGRPHPTDGARGATPRRPGSPVLRWALCRRATPHTPVSDSAVIGRLLPRSPAVFPVRKAGRPSRRPFRGLRRLHTCCGPSRQQAGSAHGGPMSRGLQPYGYPSGPSVAPGVYRQLPRPDLHRQEHSAFHGALSDWG